jgi:hypothetical protein
MTDPAHRGYTIFCDDIRNERGNKTTFVGTYDAEMTVHGSFPCILPKFALAIRYQELRGVYTDEPVTLQIYMPGDKEGEPTFSGDMADAAEARKNIKIHPLANANLPRYMQLAVNLVASPFAIPQPGEILVRAKCGSEVVKLGSLLVVPAEESAASPSASERPS